MGGWGDAFTLCSGHAETSYFPETGILWLLTIWQLCLWTITSSCLSLWCQPVYTGRLMWVEWRTCINTDPLSAFTARDGESAHISRMNRRSCVHCLVNMHVRLEEGGRVFRHWVGKGHYGTSKYRKDPFYKAHWLTVLGHARITYTGLVVM